MALRNPHVRARLIENLVTVTLSRDELAAPLSTGHDLADLLQDVEDALELPSGNPPQGTLEQTEPGDVLRSVDEVVICRPLLDAIEQVWARCGHPLDASRVSADACWPSVVNAAASAVALMQAADRDV
jgi:hypothetical protein